MLPLLTTEDEIRWALKVSKCERCRPQCWQGQVFIWALKVYRKKIDGESDWQRTVDENNDNR